MKTLSEVKNYPKKVEISHFAAKTYKKTMAQIPCFLRGEPYDSHNFIQKMKLLDEIIIDLPLAPEKYHESYRKEFCETK